MATVRHTAQDDIIMKRRERVASLRNRGMTQREICATLAAPRLSDGSPNPSFMLNFETQQPYDLATINRDLQWLRKQDLKKAEAATTEHRARQLAEITELKRRSWATGDLKTLVKAIELEAKITGTIVQKHELTGANGGPIDLRVDDLSDIYQEAAEYERSVRQGRKIIPHPAAANE